MSQKPYPGLVITVGSVIVCFAAIVQVSPRAQDVENAVAAGDRGRLRSLLQAVEDGLPYVPHEVLVRFRPDVETWQQASVLRVLRTQVSPANSRWIGDLLHISSADITDPEHAADLLRRQPEVLYAQPNYLARNKQVPNDSGYPNQWNFQSINLPGAWSINPGSRPDVLVAVIDSGLTTNTNTFGFRIWTGSAFRVFPVPFGKAEDFDHTRVNVGREFVLGWRWESSSGETILFDADGHGTHVAGTIAQETHNNQGHAGVAYRTTLLPLKTCWAYWDLQLALGAEGEPGLVDPGFNACPTDAVVDALRFAADNGARVINISIGGTGGPAPAVREALEYAVSRGAFVSIAAGNEAEEGNPTVYPAAFAPSIEGVMAVGAVNRRLERASYSSYGSYVEIVAPGGGDGPGSDDIWQTAPRQSDLSPSLLSPRFDRSQDYGISGTSMAAPHVAGVAALLYSQGINRPAAIESALKRFARDLGDAGRDDEFGFGLVDARAALRGLGLTK